MIFKPDISYVNEIIELNYQLAKEDCPDYIPPKLETIKQGVLRGLWDHNYYAWYDSNINNIVGIARIQYMESDWEASKRIFIDGVYVLPDFRRRGIGKALIQSILDDNPNVCDIQLGVKKYNYKAIALYASLGFIDEGYMLLTKQVNVMKKVN